VRVWRNEQQQPARGGFNQQNANMNLNLGGGINQMPPFQQQQQLRVQNHPHTNFGRPSPMMMNAPNAFPQTIGARLQPRPKTMLIPIYPAYYPTVNRFLGQTNMPEHNGVMVNMLPVIAMNLAQFPPTLQQWQWQRQAQYVNAVRFDML